MKIEKSSKIGKEMTKKEFMCFGCGKTQVCEDAEVLRDWSCECEDKDWLDDDERIVYPVTEKE